MILCRLLGCHDRDVKRWFSGATTVAGSEAPSINDGRLADIDSQDERLFHRGTHCGCV
jgi:DNA-binding transcriptional regulator YdaS (Cro superfamily)